MTICHRRADINYYNGQLVEEAVVLAIKYHNVYLEISALHPETDPSKEDDFNYMYMYPGWN